MSELPEITEVQRLTIKPGDRLVVRVSRRLDARSAHLLIERVRAQLHLSPDTGVLVLDDGASIIEIDGTLEAGDADQIRELVRAAQANPGHVASFGAEGSVRLTDVSEL